MLLTPDRPGDEGRTCNASTFRRSRAHKRVVPACLAGSCPFLFQKLCDVTAAEAAGDRLFIQPALLEAQGARRLALLGDSED